MAIKHVEQILTETGLTADEFKALSELPEDAADFKPSDYSGKITAATKKQLENDPEFWNNLDEKNANPVFVKKIQDGQYARAVKVAEGKLLKSLGMSETDLADLAPEERTKFDIVVTKLGEKFASSKVTDKQIQSELVEARKKLEQFETDAPQKEAELREQIEGQSNARILDFIFLSELASIPNLKVPAKILFDSISKELKNNYAFDIEDINAIPKQKANKNLKVLDGAKELSTKDLMIKILEREGALGDGEQKEKKESGTYKAKVEPKEGQGLVISGHVKKLIDANL